MLRDLYSIARAIATWLMIVVLYTNTLAQSGTACVPFPLIRENFSLSGYTEYTITDKEAALAQVSSYTFHPLDEATSEVRLSPLTKTAWIRFATRNQLLTDTMAVLKVEPANDRLILYEQIKGGLTERGRSGKNLPVTQLSVPDDDKRIRFRIKAGQTQTFLLQEQYSSGSHLSVPVLQSAGQAALEQMWHEKTITSARLYFFVMLAGFHLSIFFFSFIRYYSQKKDRAYLFYSLFNGFTFLLYLVDTNTVNLESFLWNNLKNNAEGSLVVNVVNLLFYVAFQIELLQLQTNKPKIVQCVKVYTGILLAGLLLTLIVNQVRILPFIGEYTLLLFQTGYILGSGILIYLTRKLQGFYKYVFYASIFQLAGCCVFIAVTWWRVDVYLPSWFSVDFFLAVPVALEVMFFLIALAYRDKQVEVEKIKAEHQLIEQLEENKRLQDSFTRSLERQVKDKTEQLVLQRSILEKEREAKLTAEFEQKFSESELKALRSQINPHFIFNVLNTIESYALQNNSVAVSDIIQKFSKLTRLVLENSMQPLVLITQDLEALQLYIKLEQMRYDKQFKVRYDIDPTLLETGYYIPAMIIQPYVENAILHGLRNLKEEEGLLQITGCVADEYISITIEDNGIGRKKAASLKENNPVRRNSVGMKVTHSRIEILNSLLAGNKASVEIDDMPTGTKVRILFPLLHYSS